MHPVGVTSPGQAAERSTPNQSLDQTADKTHR